jgi:hypothetical protein
VKGGEGLDAALGVGGHYNQRRWGFGKPYEAEVASQLLAVDVGANLTKYAELRGEFYSGAGSDDGFNGIGPGVKGDPGATTATPYTAIGNSGYWGQLILKPLPQVWILFGYGASTVSLDDLKKAGVADASTRTGDTQMHAGIIGNVNNTWRFGLEWVDTRSKYLGSKADGSAEFTAKASQIAFGTQFKF